MRAYRITVTCCLKCGKHLHSQTQRFRSTRFPGVYPMPRICPCGSEETVTVRALVTREDGVLPPGTNLRSLNSDLLFDRIREFAVCAPVLHPAADSEANSNGTTDAT